MFNLDFYRVGGCIRDTLMGKSPKDIDYMVVGSSEEEMLSLGFKKVGADFPVFLHPETQDEWALARQERSTGESYQDFSFKVEGVSAKEDMYRRDLTINALCEDKEGNIHDFFGGLKDHSINRR